MRSVRIAPVALLLVAASAAPAEDRWIRLVSPHFEMYTTTEEKTAREAILHFERVREFLTSAAPLKLQGDHPTRIVAFRDPAMYQIYAPNQMVLSYFAPGQQRDFIVMQNPSPQSYPITIHEYVHALVQHSGLRLPLWLNEGWADVYSTLKPSHDGVAVGDLIPDRIATLSKGQWFGLNELAAINASSPEYHESARTGIFYAESWALAHMLYLSPEYKAGFGKFLAALNGGQSMDAALQTAFARNSGQVFADLQTYLSRKTLVGTVFLTPFEKAGEKAAVSPVSIYDSTLAMADLHAAVGHQVDAARLYRQLEEAEPNRPDAYAGAGYMAIRYREMENARREFTKAYALGSTDAKLCLQLAVLDRDAKQPKAQVMAEMERSVKLQPDFSEALYELGLMKVDSRDFDAGYALLTRVTGLPSDRTGPFNAALAYASLARGEIETARNYAGAALKVAANPAAKAAVEGILRLIDARAKPGAGVHPGEKLLHAEGLVVGMRCESPESGLVSKLGLVVGGKQLLFDLPEAAAVEILKRPDSQSELKCGPLGSFPLSVEYAAGDGKGPTVGMVRRIEY